MGFDANTLETIITLSGSRGQEVHLTAAEVLRMLDDYSTPAQEHRTQWFQTELPVTEHLSNDHDIVFGWFNNDVENIR